MAIPLPDFSVELDRRLEEMGFELVEARWVGSVRRPILRVRMDVFDAVPGKGGVSVDQCAQVSRALEAWLDAHPQVPERYVLEVSSPGVDRPLTRVRDWERFKGQRVRLKGESLLDEGVNRLEGELLGLEAGDGGESRVAILLDPDRRVLVPLERIKKAHLVYRWDR
jgi:ribosome maturation factor RimP